MVAALRAQGIQRIVMLTGDNERVAAAIGAELGIDEVYADLLPEEKVRLIERAEARRRPVAMVGDGVNDAPALATATIGVAMGGAGTDVALETADVVLMGDDLTRLPYAIDLSRRTRRTIRQNLVFALGVIVRPGRLHARARHPVAAGRGRPRGEHGDRGPQRPAAAAHAASVGKRGEGSGNSNCGKSEINQSATLVATFSAGLPRMTHSQTTAIRQPASCSL